MTQIGQIHFAYTTNSISQNALLSSTPSPAGVFGYKVSPRSWQPGPWNRSPFSQGKETEEETIRLRWTTGRPTDPAGRTITRASFRGIRSCVQQMGIFQRYDTPMRRAVWMLWCTVNDPGNHKHTSEFRKPVVLAGGTHWYVTTDLWIKINNAAEPRKELGGYYYYYCKDGGHVLCWLLFGRHKHITENFVA